MISQIQPLLLAAGYGSRFQPLTKFFPKPVLPFHNEPLCSSTLKQLDHLSFESIWINTHHLNFILEEQIRLIPLSTPITFYPEPSLLQAGGTLTHLSHKTQKPFFLVLSGDIQANWDLKSFINSSLNLFTQNQDLKLILQTFPTKKNPSFFRDENHQINNSAEKRTPQLFANLQLISTDYLRSLPHGSGSYGQNILKPLDSKETLCFEKKVQKDWRNFTQISDLKKTLPRIHHPHFSKKLKGSYFELTPHLNTHLKSFQPKKFYPSLLETEPLLFSSSNPKWMIQDSEILICF